MIANFPPGRPAIYAAEGGGGGVIRLESHYHYVCQYYCIRKDRETLMCFYNFLVFLCCEQNLGLGFLLTVSTVQYVKTKEYLIIFRKKRKHVVLIPAKL